MLLIEQIIDFDRKTLKKTSSYGQRTSALKRFLQENNFILTQDKLLFLIDILEERQQNERPYTYPFLYWTISIGLIVSVFSYVRTLSLGNAALPIAKDAGALLLLCASLWVGLTVWLIVQARRRKYHRLISVLRNCYLEY